MTIGITGSATDVEKTSTPGSGTTSPSYTVETGDRRYLYVKVSGHRTTANQPATATGTYYKGATPVAMDVVATKSAAIASSSRPDITILGMPSPDEGSNALAITFDNGYNAYSIQAATYLDVLQSGSVDIIDTEEGSSTTNTLSVTTTGANREIIIALNYRDGTGTLAVEGSETIQLQVQTGVSTTADIHCGFADYNAPTAGAYSDSMTSDKSKPYCGVMIALIEDDGATPENQSAAFMLGL